MTTPHFNPRKTKDMQPDTIKPNVLITGRIPREWLGELATLAHVDIWQGNGHYLMPRKELLAAIGACHGLINFTDVKTDQALLTEATQLKIIANCSIGFDNLDIPLLTARGIWASNAPGFFSYPVSEYVLAGILVLSRKLLEADDFVRQGKWNSFQPGRWDGMSLKDKIVGIVGLGATGIGLRKMVMALGAETVYYSPSKKREPGWVSFEELISISDIVSIHVPLTPQTNNLFSREIIGRMKPGAILVNTSRGAVVDQQALISALQQGSIAGAVLDVFRNEPEVPAELMGMKNVLLTPHLAGGTRSSREASMKLAIRNVVAVLKGNKPPNALNHLPAHPEKQTK